MGRKLDLLPFVVLEREEPDVIQIVGYMIPVLDEGGCDHGCRGGASSNATAYTDVDEASAEDDEVLPDRHAVARSSDRFDLGLDPLPGHCGYGELPEVPVMMEGVLM